MVLAALGVGAGVARYPGTPALVVVREAIGELNVQ